MIRPDLQVKNNLANEKLPCVVYDVVEKKKILEFESLISCARSLGIAVETVSDNIKYKRRNRTNNLGKIITIRAKGNI